MKSAKSKRQLTLLTLVAALGVAVYLNWEYAKNDSPYAMQGAAAVNATVETEEEQPVLEALPDKNYGDAQLVSAGAESTDSYFEQARLSRTKTRDEALDKMQSTLKNTQLTDAEKKTITENLTAVIEGITLESDIENLIKAKGFADCVAFLEDSSANIAVKTGSEGLSKAEVAQIRDIVINKGGVQAQNISIVEVK